MVDGQKVETTPFARGIPLRPGTHYVRLEHPNAPTERRTVRIVSGDTVLLDVKMKASGSSIEPGPSAEPLGTAESAPDAPALDQTRSSRHCRCTAGPTERAG